MSAVSKESEDEAEAAGTSSMMESSMMEGEEYYNPDTTVAWSEKVSGGEQLCRICAGPNEYLIPIFSGEGLEHQLGMKIEKHLPIQVLEHDKLPVQVCYQCASTLIAWHDLVVGCVEAEKKLRQLYQQQNVEEEEEEDDFGDDDRTELFADPVDSEMAEDPLEPSTSTSTATRSTRSPRKKSVTRAKPKLKMTLVKTPAALPKSPPKLLQPKEEQVEADPATERYGESYDSSSVTVKSELGQHKLVCGYCGMHFVLATELVSHLTQTHQLSVFHCDVCDVLYSSSKQEFEKHVSGHLNVKRHSCVVCRKEFARRTDLKRHMNVHVPDRTYKCSVCRKSFATRFQHSEHRKSHISEDLWVGSKVDGYSCTLCSKTFARQFDVKRHIISKHKSDKRVTVPSAEVKIEVVSATDEAVTASVKKKAKKQKVFPCKVCGRLFTTPYNVTRHLQMHGDDVEPAAEDGDHLVQHTKLPIVDKLPYRQDDSTEVSQARYVADGRVRYRCGRCDQTINKRYNFIRHLRIHTGEKPFTCHVCGKQFRTSLLLIRHFKDIHLRIKNYSCDICMKAFAHSSGRNDHRLIHFDKRSFVCHICGKSYKTRSCLNVHGRSHREDTKKFACKHCDKKFRTTQNLTSHERVHTGVKPHSCSECEKSFRYISSLTRHALIHTSLETSFKCDLCDKSFTMLRYLRTHVRLNHAE